MYKLLLLPFFCLFSCISSAKIFISKSTIEQSRYYLISNLNINNNGLLNDTIIINNTEVQTFHRIFFNGIDSIGFSINKSKTKLFFSKSNECFSLFQTKAEGNDTLVVNGRVRDKTLIEISIGNSDVSQTEIDFTFVPKYNTIHFFTSTFMGIITVMMMLTFIYYRYLHHNYFLDYGLYLLAILIFFIIRYIIEPFLVHDLSKINTLEKIAYSTQALFYVGYFRFVRSFLETKKSNPKLDLLAKLAVRYSIVSYFFMLIIFYFNDQYGTIYFTIFRIVIAILAVIAIILGLRQKQILVNILAVGSSMLLLGALLAMYYTMNFESERLGIQPIFYMQIGMLLEFIFFNSGIAYKTFLLSREKESVSIQLLESMKLNENILKEKEHDLIQKIEQAKIQIKQYEQEQIRQEYKLKEKDMEMQILRSQINPHFVFNTINALKSLTLQNKYEEVGEYFDDFSKLLRLFLETSRHKKVELQKELDLLKLYVRFENLRRRYNIHFTITIDKNIDPEFTEVPTNIIQPFIENAIWHGLSHQEKVDGKIELNVNQDERETLFISIEDNGIGRKAASAYKSTTHFHKSLAIEIIKERLQLSNKSKLPSVTITDLYDEENKGKGTKVELRIEME